MENMFSICSFLKKKTKNMVVKIGIPFAENISHVLLSLLLSS